MRIQFIMEFQNNIESALQSEESQDPFVGQVFPSHDFAVKFIEAWSESNFVPLAKVSFLFLISHDN